MQRSSTVHTVWRQLEGSDMLELRLKELEENILRPEEVDDNVFELDKSSNWYSPGGTFPVLYLG